MRRKISAYKNVVPTRTSTRRDVYHRVNQTGFAEIVYETTKFVVCERNARVRIDRRLLLQRQRRVDIRLRVAERMELRRVQ